jgi:hypothetical protein
MSWKASPTANCGLRTPSSQRVLYYRNFLGPVSFTDHLRPSTTRVNVSLSHITLRWTPLVRTRSGWHGVTLKLLVVAGGYFCYCRPATNIRAKMTIPHIEGIKLGPKKELSNIAGNC